MASRPKRKMTSEERAKQFMPFSALKGLEKALHQKEKIIEDRVELSEEESEKIDQKLRRLHEQDVISLEYYEDGTYIRQTGQITNINRNQKLLEIESTPIFFKDIRDIL